MLVLLKILSILRTTGYCGRLVMFLKYLRHSNLFFRIMVLSLQTLHMVVFALLGTIVLLAPNVPTSTLVQMVLTVIGLVLKERINVSHVILGGLAQEKVWQKPMEFAKLVTIVFVGLKHLSHVMVSLGTFAQLDTTVRLEVLPLNNVYLELTGMYDIYHHLGCSI